MTAASPATGPPSNRPSASRFKAGPGSASVYAIALGAGFGALSFSFWVPFIPLYMQDLGATSDANALFWVGVATTVQGVARLVSGPFWGILSDRVGRKIMYIRALYFGTFTTLIAAFAQEPWHIAVAFAMQGLFSGFIPAAVALTSVTVPEHRLSNSLGLVTAAQYLGSTAGPALGALLAVFFGLRGAIVAAALMPAIAATMVLFVVPRDRVERGDAPGENAEPADTRPFRQVVGRQFYLALLFYFFIFATSQLIRLAAPVSLKEITGKDDVEALIGIAFTLAGVSSVLGVLIVARRFIRPGRFAGMLALGALVTAAAHVLLAFSFSAPLYILWFCFIALSSGALLPASNTLIAANVPRARRGTAFGFAGSAQALAFMVGPMGAAVIAAVSFKAGYIVLGGLFVGMAGLAWFALREPTPKHHDPAAGSSR